MLGSISYVPGNKGSVLGLSLGLGVIRMVGVYMARIFENAKASALASLILGSSVGLAALPARNGERMSGLTWGNNTVHTSNSFSIPAPLPQVLGHLSICNK